METVIRLRNVNHYYGTGSLRRQILFDLSVDVMAGEIVILTGPSGSGKTTLLTLSGALRSLDEGSLQVLDTELKGASPKTLERVRQNIGFIFQAHNLIPALTACQNVQMAAQLANSETGHITRQESIKMLEAVGLRDRVDHYPSQLSGGQKQRVAIARALVRKPKIILADEPTAALDRKSGREVVEILQRLAKEQGCAILFVTHDNRILDIADRILTLEDGRIVSFASGIAANAGHLLSAFAHLQRKGELLRYVDSMSDKQFVEVAERLTLEFEQLLRTLDLGNSKAVEALLDEMLESLTLKVKTLLNAERATIYLVDEEHRMLHSKIAQGEAGKKEQIDIPISTGIAGHVAVTGIPLNVPDAYSHPLFNREIDRGTGYHTRSVLCVPIHDRQKRVFAVAQLLNKRDGNTFTSADESRLVEFSNTLGVIVESWTRLNSR
jgi:putative ABC transport system ATP-binding protein